MNTVTDALNTITPSTGVSSGSDQSSTEDKMLVWNDAAIHLRRLVQTWTEEVENTKIRRETRDVDVDVEDLRQRGDLDEDETLVPVRVIDTNIQREQPAYINYLKNSRRLCVFNCLSEPEIDTQKLEEAFTRGMTYTGWEKDHFKCLDGSQTHGWDSVEVVLDETKPLNVAIEHIGHDNLFFPRSNINIQFAPRIIRKYDMTLSQLDKFVSKYGFSAAQVSRLKEVRRNTQKETETLIVYKCFFKKDGQVFVSWFSLEAGVDDWLCAPAALDLGIAEQQMQPQTVMQTDPLTGMTVPTTVMQPVWVPSPIKQYPIFILPYRQTEKPRIIDHKGRAFLDENKQEAQTAILSSFINGLTRASNIYASPSAEDGTGSSLKEIENLKLAGGRVLSKPMDFWSPPYPDAMVLTALQHFDVANSQETNQPNFAVVNRKDSRKTAKEIDTANEQQALLNSVQLTMFSTFIREVYSFAWLIVQSQAIQNKISFLLVKMQRPVMNPAAGNTPMVDEMGQPKLENVWVNDVERIQQRYDVRAAGDIDVIARTEKINQMMQDWPVIQNTSLRSRFLADLIKLKYPDTGDQYAAILEQDDQLAQLKGMVGRLGTIMAGAMKQHPEMMTALPPEQQADVGALVQQAMAVGQTMQQQQTQTQ